jgi:IclR family transcriptional regulator, KDG regulon repressor
MDSTVVKALAVLEMLARQEEAARLTDIAAELRLSRSNVHRLLRTLQHLGYVRQRPDSARYEATIRLWEVGVRVLGRDEIRKAAEPAMKGLARDTAANVHLSRLDASEIVYLGRIDSTQPIACTEVGARAPAHCTATGKALLAWQDLRVIEQATSHLVALTPRTLTDTQMFLEHLETIRSEGYAINRGEWRAGECALAAPIFGRGGRPVAAIGISGFDDRLRGPVLRGLAPGVVEAAQQVTRRLGAADARLGRRAEPRTAADARAALHRHAGRPPARPGADVSGD